MAETGDYAGYANERGSAIPRALRLEFEAEAGDFAHPHSCACAGRGWFVDHRHRRGCADYECVGCRRVLVACTERSERKEHG